MNRRSFLGSLVAAGAGVAVSSLVPFDLDPERALWVPGRKTFILPSIQPVTANELLVVSGGHGNVFLTPDWITREALAVLKRNLAFSTLVNREFDASFIARGSLARPVVGEKVTIRTPMRFA